MSNNQGWQFWIDRGGTFTDIIARNPQGITHSHKLLSQNPEHYQDSVIQGIRNSLNLTPEEKIPLQQISSIRIGTTVATNALLERTGEKTALLTTKGFRDVLRIGYQSRPKLFDLDIKLPEMLYQKVIEVNERVSSNGEVLIELDEIQVRKELEALLEQGYTSLAIVLLHGYRYHHHEEKLAQMARSMGFGQVSTSHETSPLIKIVPRGDTTVVDSYLTPVLRKYVDGLSAALSDEEHSPELLFMQSNGGLCKSEDFSGKDALLSGPAGGIVGMVEVGARAGFDKLIGFDMGGTSTDVSHYAGTYDRVEECEVAGVRVRTPMLEIHTVAAGGGSLLWFDGSRMRVGPASAGANPGPACYGRGGGLTITDANVLLGKIRPEYFPRVFGDSGKEPLDREIVVEKFNQLTSEVAKIGINKTAEELAQGFLDIAVESMANAIKKISIERGHDLSDYTLSCFGGAGGQHACLVAEKLGISQIHIHPLAGVLSALGIGLAKKRKVATSSFYSQLENCSEQRLLDELESLRSNLDDEVNEYQFVHRIALKYASSDTRILVDYFGMSDLKQRFEKLHLDRFGFNSNENIVIDYIQCEAVEIGQNVELELGQTSSDESTTNHQVSFNNSSTNTLFYRKSGLVEDQQITGPAIILDEQTTIVIEPNWQATHCDNGDIIIKQLSSDNEDQINTEVDPIQLELFNNRFMNIAEQMGLVLASTAASVNIKERLDFSCAVFTGDGELIANAPHVPVHLGSMGDSVKSILEANPQIEPGDVYVMNAPYSGGTHLPDITVIKPVFDSSGKEVLFNIAARGHHADIGGTVPGSAPANSTNIEQEGVLIDNHLLVQNGQFLESQIHALLSSGKWPARNPQQNIADLKAQVAACSKGEDELLKMTEKYGIDVVKSYMTYVQENATKAVKQVISNLEDGEFTKLLDDGSQIKVKITVNGENAIVDFTGTSSTHPGNFNAPSSIANSAILYCFRCLVEDDIPLNSGCLKPIEIILPTDSMINPSHPAAVFSGNVETSQAIVDAVFGALGICGASHGTMNNLIFGNDDFQYYETLCGGAGATKTMQGADAVHTHMTNSRLTDPEVLESRFPVRLNEFSIRQGSGGEGLNRGGHGVTREIEFLEKMQVNIISSSRQVAPYGIQGGGEGKVGKNILISQSGDSSNLPSCASLDLAKGERLVIKTPGGGSYGTHSLK